MMAWYETLFMKGSGEEISDAELNRSLTHASSPKSAVDKLKREARRIRRNVLLMAKGKGEGNVGQVAFLTEYGLSLAKLEQAATALLEN